MSRNRFAVMLVATIVVGLAALSFPRAAILRAMGNALVATDALTPVDVIVVAADTFEAGALDAADLVAQHVASRVAVFTIAPRGETPQEGNPIVRKISRTEWMVSLLSTRGIPVIRIPTPVSGTTDSVPVLVDWATAHDVRSVLLVTAPDHSRRLRHVVERERTSRAITILVRPTRYSRFDADRWWQSRDGRSTFGKEFPKLVADAALHPWSYVF
jgi:hypothetical protein